MLPETEHGPPSTDESRVHASVAFDVPLQLARPEVGIQTRGRAMQRTTMPKTPVHEHGEQAAGERDIDSYTQLIEIYSVILPKAETHTM